MLACGSLTTTVSGLVKVVTGLAKVDSAAYLRQAAEVDYSVPSAGTTHPENVLRRGRSRSGRSADRVPTRSSRRASVRSATSLCSTCSGRTGWWR